MENPKIYVSKTVEAMVDENHPLSEKLKKMECTFCTQSVWSVKGGGGLDGKSKVIECFCLKTHMQKWEGTSPAVITDCDGFTNQPLTNE